MSFGDEVTSSPSLPSRHRFSSSVPRNDEAINATSEEGEGLGPEHIGAGEDNGSGEHDDNADVLYLEQLRGARSSNRNVEPIEGGLGDESGRPPSKKRKISGESGHRRDVITISSSPSPNQTSLKGGSDHDMSDTDSVNLNPTEKRAQDENGPDMADVATSPTGPVSTVPSSRFRPPTPAIFPAPTPLAKPLFKKPPDHRDDLISNLAGATLPDAFSPSRRRVKRDYVSGSAADTVRNWVLGLAAEESKAGQGYVEKVRVVEIRRDDGENRSTVVRGEDGRFWLLIDEHAGIATRSHDAARREVHVGRTIGIRGGGTGLEISLRKWMSSGLVRDPTDESMENWGVSVLWDVFD